MAVLAVIGIEALRRLIGREFPDAEFRPLGIEDRITAWREGRADASTEAPTAAIDPKQAQVDQLERLAALFERRAHRRGVRGRKAAQLAEH